MTDYLTSAPKDPSPSREEPRDPTFRIVGDPAPLFAAMAKARAEFEPIQKTREVKVQPINGSAYTFDYAELDEVLRCTTKALSANGLNLFSSPPYRVAVEDRTIRVNKRDGGTFDKEVRMGLFEIRHFLSHASGAYLETVDTFEAPADEPQKMGSHVTYRRRYAAGCLLGVAAEADDDGNAAQGNEVVSSVAKGQAKPQAPRKAAPAPVQPKAPSPPPKPPSVPPAATGDTDPAPGTNPANDKPLTPVSEGTWNAVKALLLQHSYTRPEASSLFGKFGEGPDSLPFPDRKPAYSEETAIQVLRYLQEQK